MTARRGTVTTDVQGPDGRYWTVTRTPEWIAPDQGRRFEIDSDGAAGGGGWVVLGAVILFWVVLAVWSPAQVHVPWYFWLGPVAVAGLLALLWWVKRPWTLSAVTAGYGEEPADRVVVVARGRRRARKTMDALVDRLAATGRPDERDTDAAPMPATGQPSPTTAKDDVT